MSAIQLHPWKILISSESKLNCLTEKLSSRFKFILQFFGLIAEKSEQDPQFNMVVVELETRQIVGSFGQCSFLSTAFKHAIPVELWQQVPFNQIH